MIFDYSWLQSFFNKKLPAPEKLADLLSCHSFETKSVKGGLDVFVPPVRAGDCLNYYGLSLEIGAILGYKVKFSLPETSISKGKSKFKVTVKDVDACPRYLLTKWSDVKISDSNSQIKSSLEKAGLKSINAAVDLANYLMLEMGQPVHVFDADKINGDLIEIRPAKENEEIISLEGKKYILSKDVLVIADNIGPLAIAGIKGGQRAEVTPDTKNILMEMANFESRTVRKSIRQINLKTDASSCFENGLDPNLIDLTLKRAEAIGSDLLSPKSIKLVIDNYPHKISPRIITLDLTWARDILGASIPGSQIKKIFQGLGFEILLFSARKVKVKIPTRRLDIKAPEDLVEEIGRFYGYNKIKSESPNTLLIPPKINRDRLWKRIIKDFLIQLGLNESYQYSFLSLKEISLFKYDESNAVKLINPISSRYQYLRFSLLPNLLKASAENSKRFNQVRLFEMGKIFKSPDKEKEMLGITVFDNQSGFQEFYMLKGVIESLLGRLGITDVWFDGHQVSGYQSGQATWHPNHRAEIKIGQDMIGFLGEIHPRLAEELSISGQIFAAEIDLEKLINLASDQQEYEPISPYPAIVRDLSVVIPEETSIEKVIQVASLTGAELIRDIDLIDIYQDDQLAKIKSITLRIVYQSPDKNLSATDVNAIERKIVQEFQKLNWYLRQPQSDDT